MAGIICPYCLQPLPAPPGQECPHCGRDLRNRNPEGALPLGTLLDGRYTVGEYLFSDGDGLCYQGVENAQRSFVRIKEFFPVTLCNGRGRDGGLLPIPGREVLFKTSLMDFKDLYEDLKAITPGEGLSTILDVWEENNTVYAVEESYKGMTLTHYLSLRPRPMAPTEACEMLRPVMAGVAAMHKAGLIHRGICPDNILLPLDGDARLTGYGTLALRTHGSELKSQLYGGYAAPEQYSAAEFSGTYTDVYALAAVIYRMVTNQKPVPARQRRNRDSMEAAHSLESGVPAYFSRVLACALRLDSAKRMQTVQELSSALDDPGVASAMFDRGDNQISTAKLMGIWLVVIFVLAALLLWALLAGGGGSAAPQPAGTAAPAVGGSAAPAPDAGLVPDLVGKNYRQDIEGSDLYTAYRITLVEEYSADVPEGCVIRQDPAAFSAWQQDQTLELVLSLGPPKVEMPVVLGLHETDATKKLDEAGIPYELVYEDVGNANQPFDGDFIGQVVTCSVKAGTEIDPTKTTVVLAIAGQ